MSPLLSLPRVTSSFLIWQVRIFLHHSSVPYQSPPEEAKANEAKSNELKVSPRVVRSHLGSEAYPVGSISDDAEK